MDLPNGGFLMQSKRLTVCLLWSLILGLTMPVSAANAGINPWRIRINIPECRLRLYYGAELWKTYQVAVGRPETPSPQGDFWIAVKVSDPTWYPGAGRRPVPPGPANPLGRFWLGLNRKGYGIHGNNHERSVGLPVSHGCFRMANADINELFGLVPTGTLVQVTYRTVGGWVDQNQAAFLTCFPDPYLRTTDRFRAAIAFLQQLNWNYQPHYGALAVLLPRLTAWPLNVPRQIKVVGPARERDGFYWRNSLFVQIFPEDGVAESPLFPGYALISVAGGLTARYRCDWAPFAGVLIMEAVRNEH
jgi:hypothetical protein